MLVSLITTSILIALTLTTTYTHERCCSTSSNTFCSWSGTSSCCLVVETWPSRAISSWPSHRPPRLCDPCLYLLLLLPLLLQLARNYSFAKLIFCVRDLHSSDNYTYWNCIWHLHNKISWLVYDLHVVWISVIFRALHPHPCLPTSKMRSLTSRIYLEQETLIRQFTYKSLTEVLLNKIWEITTYT